MDFAWKSGKLEVNFRKTLGSCGIHGTERKSGTWVRWRERENVGGEKKKVGEWWGEDVDFCKSLEEWWGENPEVGESIFGKCWRRGENWKLLGKLDHRRFL